MSGASEKPTDGQQAIWDVLKAAKVPTSTVALAKASGMSRPSLQWILRSWVEQGHVTQVGTGNKISYLMRGSAMGTEVAPVPTSGIRRILPEQAATHLWNGARSLPKFSAEDLRAHSPLADQISDEQLRNFINLLMRSGYLKVLSKAKPGKRPATYRLIRNTGPKPPVERRVRATFDPNEARLTHVPEVTS